MEFLPRLVRASLLSLAAQVWLVYPNARSNMQGFLPHVRGAARRPLPRARARLPAIASGEPPMERKRCRNKSHAPTSTHRYVGTQGSKLDEVTHVHSTNPRRRPRHSRWPYLSQSSRRLLPRAAMVATRFRAPHGGERWRWRLAGVGGRRRPMFGVGGTFVVDASLPNVGEGGNVGTLAIKPSNPVIEITVVDGAITRISGFDNGGTSLTFQATADGHPVSPMWSLDKGELGTIGVASGAFSTTGRFSGVAKVSATLGSLVANTTATIRLHVTQNGNSSFDAGTSEGGAGLGGLGGVGGKGEGGPVGDDIKMRLQTGGAPPATETEFGWLYPYDKTVWPRGILAPLLQWQTTHKATSVYIHLKEDNYEFEGFYSGKALVHHPINPSIWSSALTGNGGDPVHVELKISDGDKVYGPIKEDWLVASGVLKGTVYYNSYNTRLARAIPNAMSPAAALAIKPGASDPTLALPGTETHCVVCHTVSDDGSTLFAQLPPSPTSTIIPTARRTTSRRMAQSSGATPARRPTARPTTASSFGLDCRRTARLGSRARAGSITRKKDTAEIRVSFGATTGTPSMRRVSTARSRKRSRRFLARRQDGGFRLRRRHPGSRGRPGAHARHHELRLRQRRCPHERSAELRHIHLLRAETSVHEPDVTNGFVGWPGWLPDSSGIVFHNVLSRPNAGSSPLSTWHDAKAQIWFADISGGPRPAQGRSSAGPQRHRSGGEQHFAEDCRSRRRFRNELRANDEPHPVRRLQLGRLYVATRLRERGQRRSVRQWRRQGAHREEVVGRRHQSSPDTGPRPSHPAFYLPGQELNAGNMRGFWAVEPCRADGVSCETGDECCNGFCRPDATSKLVCGGKPPGCAQAYEKCSMTSDCCGAAMGYECINGFCVQPTPQIQ